MTLPRHADENWSTGSSTSSGCTGDRPGRAHRRLAERGVQTRPYFAPIHLQPFYRATFGFKPGDFPVTERVAASTLALPFSSRLTDGDAAYVADALVDIVHRDGRRSKDQPGARVNPDPRPLRPSGWSLGGGQVTQAIEELAGYRAVVVRHGARWRVAGDRKLAPGSLCDLDGLTHGMLEYHRAEFRSQTFDDFAGMACGMDAAGDNASSSRRRLTCCRARPIEAMTLATPGRPSAWGSTGTTIRSHATKGARDR